MPKTLSELFREIFELDVSLDVGAIKYRDVLAWDSVGHMRLIAAIEETYDVMLEVDEVLEIDSLAKAIEILKKHDVDAAT